MRIMSILRILTITVVLSPACTVAPKKPVFSLKETPTSVPGGPVNDSPQTAPPSNPVAIAPLPAPIPDPPVPDYDLRITNLPADAVHDEVVTFKVAATDSDIKRYAYLIGADCNNKPRSEFQEKNLDEDISLDASSLDEGNFHICLIGQKAEAWEDTKKAAAIAIKKVEIPREIPIEISESGAHCPRSRTVEWTGTLLLKKKSARIKWQAKDPRIFTKACAKYAKETETDIRSFVQTNEGISGIWVKNQIDTRWINLVWSDEKRRSFKSGDLGMGAPGKGKSGSIKSMAEKSEPEKKEGAPK